MEHDPTIEQRPINIMPQIVGPEYKAAWHPGLSNENYHLDRSALSSSGLKVLLKRTPAHFKANWKIGKEEDDKECFRYGSLAHLALLEPQKFKESFVLEPVFEAPTQKGEMSTRSKEALKMKAEWYSKLEPWQLVVTEKDHENIIGSIASILRHEKVAKIIPGSKVEQSGYFRESTTGIKCRIRPDILHFGKKVLLDFKTAEDASKSIFSSKMGRLMYPISLIFYGQGVKAIEGWEPDIYGLLVTEKEDPWATCLYTLTPQTISTAKAWFFHGMETLKRCLETGDWPAYQKGEAEDIDLPPWEHSKELPLYDFKEGEINGS
jgi:hypothetical protein